MPTYTYINSKGRLIEMIRPMADRDATVTINGETFHRVFDMPNVIAKHFTAASDTGKAILQGWKDIEAKEGSAFSSPFSVDQVKQACEA